MTRKKEKKGKDDLPDTFSNILGTKPQAEIQIDSDVMDYSAFVASVALCQQDNNKKLFTELLGKKVRCNFCKKIVNKAVEAGRSDFRALVCPYCKELWIEWGLPGNKITLL